MCVNPFARRVTPVEDGGHVACGFEVATGGRCQQVAEWVLTSFGREVDQVCPQGRPGGFSGESGDVLIGLVELCEGLRSDKLLGCDVEAVDVALDRLEEPGSWIVELAQHGAPSTALVGDIAVWRAANGVNPQDPRPTGGTQLEMLPALRKQRVDRDIAPWHQPARRCEGRQATRRTHRTQSKDVRQRPYQQPERRPSGPSAPGR